MLFRDTPVETLAPNQLVIHIQPDEGISLSFGAKMPGPQLRLGNVNMGFDYDDYFGERSNTGYERLLYDCHARRRHAVPARRHGGGRLERRAADARRLEGAAAAQFPELRRGHVGPAEAEELIARGGRQWRNGD